ncbi:MAG: redoxin domain-containing protein [Alphaproteobacteria bacterium]|nr:redoxin domain-containing protein [Alphaproteobacteria bacterium]
MSFSKSNLLNYIKYFALPIVLACGFSCDVHAYEWFRKKFFEITDKEQYPYENNWGYIKGGLSFDEIVFDEQGKGHLMKEFKGNVIVMLFTTTWCPNCPNVLQSLDKLADKLNELKVRNVKIIALNIGKENLNAVRIHYKAHNIQTLDVYQSIPAQKVKNINSVPTCLVFDGNGEPKWGCSGGDVDCSSTEFVEFIIRLSKKV